MKKNSHNSKLSNKEFEEIKEYYNSGIMNQYRLAKKYKVSQPSISNIVNNKAQNYIEELIK